MGGRIPWSSNTNGLPCIPTFLAPAFASKRSRYVHLASSVHSKSSSFSTKSCLKGHHRQSTTNLLYFPASSSSSSTSSSSSYQQQQQLLQQHLLSTISSIFTPEPCSTTTKSAQVSSSPASTSKIFNDSISISQTNDNCDNLSIYDLDIIAKRFDTKVQRKITKSISLTRHLDYLEALSNILAKQKYMTPERYSSLLQVAFYWAKRRLIQSNGLSNNQHVYNRVKNIYDRWQVSAESGKDTSLSLRTDFPCSEPIWRYHQGTEALFRNNALWSIVSKALGFDRSSPLDYNSISHLVRSLRNNSVHSSSLHHRDFMYLFIIRSLLMSIDWHKFRHYTDQDIIYSTTPSSLSPLSIFDETASRLTLAIQLRIEYQGIQRENGTSAKHIEESAINSSLARALFSYAKFISDRRTRLQHEFDHTLISHSSYLSLRDFRLAALSIIESKVQAPPIEAISCTLEAALQLTDFDLARNLYLQLRHPKAPTRIASLSSFHINTKQFIDDVGEIIRDKGSISYPSSSLTSSSSSSSPSFNWHKNNVTQCRKKFVKFFNYWHSKDPTFALLLYWDWCYTSGFAVPFPSELWPSLFASISSRLDIALLKHFLLVHHSHEDNMVSNHILNIIMNNFTNGTSIVPVYRTIRLLENFMSATYQQRLPLFVYEKYLRHVSLHSNENRVDQMMKVVRSMPYKNQTSTLNPILASIVGSDNPIVNSQLYLMNKIWDGMQKSLLSNNKSTLRNGSPDWCSYSCIIHGFNRINEFDKALSVWNEAKSKPAIIRDIKPNVIAFLMQKLARAGRVTDALQIEKDYQDYCFAYHKSNTKKEWNYVIMRAGKFVRNPNNKSLLLYPTSYHVRNAIGKHLLIDCKHSEAK